MNRILKRARTRTRITNAPVMPSPRISFMRRCCFCGAHRYPMTMASPPMTDKADTVKSTASAQRGNAVDGLDMPRALRTVKANSQQCRPAHSHAASSEAGREVALQTMASCCQLRPPLAHGLPEMRIKLLNSEICKHARLIWSQPRLDRNHMMYVDNRFFPVSEHGVYTWKILESYSLCTSYAGALVLPSQLMRFAISRIGEWNCSLTF